MQTKIHTRLSIACSSLLCMHHVHAEEPDWTLDFGLLGYAEAERNFGLEFISHAEHQLDDNESLGFTVELDTLTGATPNGASATNVPQTFTKASGDGYYRVDANHLPADDTHADTRMSLGIDYSYPVDQQWQSSYNTSLSMEFDYVSFNLGTDQEYSFNNNNTKFHLGGDFEYAQVHPVGSLPVPLQTMNPPGTLQARDGASTPKFAYGINTGITQVLSHASLLQVIATITQQKGYLNDPYRILSLIEDRDDSGDTLAYLYESRPDFRNSNAIRFRLKQALQQDSLDGSVRFYSDDWGIRSITLDVSWRHIIDTASAWIPGIRLYTQSAADFYHHSLRTSETLPEYASSDYRLAEFTAITLTLEHVFIHSYTNSRMGIRYYRASGESHPHDAVGLQRQQDLYPTLQALMITWSRGFAF